jgi:hypothetical protein
MKNQNSGNIERPKSITLARCAKHAGRSALLAICLALALTANRAPAANNPGVFPVSLKTYYGKTYGEWVVSYWQWAMSIPISVSPWANDPSGAYAATGQSGPVWFLGGTLGDSVTRNITIPADKAIFLPVHQWIFGALVFDCDPSNPGVTCDVQTLKKTAADATKAATVVEVTIDGRMLSDTKDYRATSSPSAFNVTVPADNITTAFGVPTPAGTYGPHVADGYYMLLAPLSAGSHVIVVHVVSPVAGEYFITYNITST